MSSQVQGRMISEVLKRNPNLVSGGKNTKLKIVQRSPWWAKARVSFVLLKPTSGDEDHASASTKPSILRQHNAAAVGKKTGASGMCTILCVCVFICVLIFKSVGFCMIFTIAKELNSVT